MEGIQNYYERLVSQQLAEMQTNLIEFDLTDSDWADAACLALNDLPSRYYRHGVDFCYHVSTQERSAMASQVEAAVAKALRTVQRAPRL